MELLILLGLGLTAGTFALLNDDDDSESSEGEVINGTEERDLITATEDDDTVSAGEGGDVVAGGDGEDILRGGDGSDIVMGEEGDDWIGGGLGDDWLQGDQGSDTLSGGYGDDGLIGGLGSDSLDGGAGDDFLIGLTGYEFEGDDVVDDPEAFDGLRGGRFYGIGIPIEDDNADDVLNGGDGNDLLAAGAGDTMTGGDGSDSFATGYWVAEDGMPTVTDFSPAEDTLVYYQPAYGELQDLSFGTEENDAGGVDAILYADGSAVMRVVDAGPLDVGTHIRQLRAAG